ncbi:hypothetical protein HMPREF0662_01987, partial [Prevotella nigrescens F0103]
MKCSADVFDCSVSELVMVGNSFRSDI